MRRILRRQQHQVCAVKAGAVQVNEIGIAALLFTGAEEIHHPILFVHSEGSRNIAVTRGNRIFELAGSQIVKIQMTPVIALREPDHLVGCGQKPPVRQIVSAVESCRYSLLDDIADLSGCGVRHAEGGVFMIARGGHECELVAVCTPFDIGEGAFALDVIAQGRAVRIRRHLQAHDVRGIDVDDHPLDFENVRVSGKWVFPGFECRMADSRVHQIHFADSPAVVLKRRDLL